MHRRHHHHNPHRHHNSIVFNHHHHHRHHYYHHHRHHHHRHHNSIVLNHHHHHHRHHHHRHHHHRHHNSIVLNHHHHPHYHCHHHHNSIVLKHHHHRHHNSIVLNHHHHHHHHRHHNSLKNRKRVSLVQSAIMSRVVNNNHGFLQLLAHCPTHQCEFLLRTATPQQVQALVQGLYNVLKQYIPFPEENRQKLLPYKDVLISLAEPNVPYEKKKRILVHDLLPPVISSLGFLLL